MAKCILNNFKSTETFCTKHSKCKSDHFWFSDFIFVVENLTKSYHCLYDSLYTTFAHYNILLSIIFFTFDSGGANCHYFGYQIFVSQIMWVEKNEDNISFSIWLVLKKESSSSISSAKSLSILTDPKWYPARQSLRLDPSMCTFSQ